MANNTAVFWRGSQTLKLCMLIDIFIDLFIDSMSGFINLWTCERPKCWGHLYPVTLSVCLYHAFFVEVSGAALKYPIFFTSIGVDFSCFCYSIQIFKSNLVHMLGKKSFKCAIFLITFFLHRNKIVTFCKVFEFF